VKGSVPFFIEGLHDFNLSQVLFSLNPLFFFSPPLFFPFSFASLAFFTVQL
jgi:hypothetical protein